jgi:hypothetical protein
MVLFQFTVAVVVVIVLALQGTEAGHGYPAYVIKSDYAAPAAFYSGPSDIRSDPATSSNQQAPVYVPLSTPFRGRRTIRRPWAYAYDRF